MYNRRVKIDGSKFVLSLLVGMMFSYVISISKVEFISRPLFEIAIFAATSFFCYQSISYFWKTNNSVEPIRLSNDKRNSSIDLIRTVAAIFVHALHSITTIGYYENPINSKTMYMLSALRWIELTCVPIFFLLTGYLCIERTNIKKIYLSLIPYYLLFVISQLLNIPKSTWQEALFNIISIPPEYGYFEAYIGIVMLMPFLNILYKNLNLETKKLLIVSLLVITSLPTIVCVEVPTYWLFLYPVTYYYIGAFLREKPILSKTFLIAILFVLIITIETTLTIVNTSSNNCFNYYIFNGYQCDYPAFIVVISSILLFTLLSRIEIKSRIVIKILSLTGKNSLGTYLFEGMIAGIVYSKVMTGEVFNIYQLAKLQPILVLITYTMSLVLSIIFTSIIEIILSLVKKYLIRINFIKE